MEGEAKKCPFVVGECYCRNRVCEILNVEPNVRWRRAGCIRSNKDIFIFHNIGEATDPNHWEGDDLILESGDNEQSLARSLLHPEGLVYLFIHTGKMQGKRKLYEFQGFGTGKAESKHQIRWSIDKGTPQD